MSTTQWHDLMPRVITGVVLIAIGAVVVSLGGAIFAIFSAIVAGVIVWELARMIDPDSQSKALQIGVVATIAILLARNVGDALTLPLLSVPTIVGVIFYRQKPWLFAAYAFGICLAGFALTYFRDVYGLIWVLVLIVIVVLTDIAGYFAGRLIGGPKFWPAISPKKTWSGTVAGWICAAIVGLGFTIVTGASGAVIVIAVLVSFSSQMGDIAESALKRHVGVKDSSNLLPGHGGLFDRFDGLLGALLFVMVVQLFSSDMALAL